MLETIGIKRISVKGLDSFQHDQVAVALRRLGSGDSLVTVGDSFGLNHSTVSQVTWRFVESMEERGLKHLHWPSTELEMNGIKSRFEKVRGLPN
ncbi:hypothetical protein Lal_00022734 [Lupinus albus]|nr:hypothetical protein Lal_00022734 [Lupinus albus]